VKPLAQACLRGVNARIARVLKNLSPLPPEFYVLDMEPEPWGARDLIRFRGARAQRPGRDVPCPAGLPWRPWFSA
jgi:hypothetical protein